MMSGSQRLLAILLASAMLIGGFAFGRMTDSPRTNAAGEAPATASALQPAQPVPATGSQENQTFYLTDYKTGYSDGYNAGAKGVNTTAIQTERTGYNDGYKEGYADAIQAKDAPRAAQSSARPAMEYRAAAAAPARRNGSTLKTALTIAAPAAIGAGIGAAAGGGRGAAAGALIGGGGGALYHLMKNRNRN